MLRVPVDSASAGSPSLCEAVEVAGSIRHRIIKYRDRWGGCKMKKAQSDVSQLITPNLDVVRFS